MPKINRIRIINFYYNNDARHIADETYSFYGGENALLNLANGGGKSVLVQLMLQPIMPDLKLQNRSMISYFKRSSYPTFIMLEWLLDNDSKKDYLMTGIAVAPKSVTDENSGNHINYFTFTSHYDAACDFDIAMVPFVRTEGENQVILSFERARESVKKVVSKYREMHYFSRDDSAAYRQYLSSFGISQEEWKTIIAKMNNDEGGIEELFEKCKTSDSVLNEWIIKTVEKVVQSTGNEEVQIHDLFEGLVTDTVRNKEYINDQKIIKEYFDEHINLENSLGRVCESLDNLDKAEEEFSRMHSSLNTEINNSEVELNNLEFERNELAEQIIHILKEEISQRYYDAEETYLENKEIERESKEELEKAKEKLMLKTKEKNSQEAAKMFKKCNELKGSLNGLTAQIEHEKSNAPVIERLDSLKYSLKIIYGKRKDENEERLASFNDMISSNKDKISNLIEQLKTSRDTLSKYTKDEGRLSNSIELFKEYEKEVFKDLEVNFARNLLEETDEKEIENKSIKLKSTETKLQSEVVSCQNRLDEIKKRNDEIQKKKEEIAASSEKLSYELINFNERYDKFKDEKETCSKILSIYEISENQIFDNQSLNKIFDGKIQNMEKEILLANNEEQQLTEMAEGVEKGRVYHPASLIKYLDDNDIYYKTGENYLNNLPEKNRMKLLENDPLLPFCIIVDKKDLSILEQISLQNAFLRQIVPVATYDKLDASLNAINKVVSMNGKYSLISSYEPKIFMDSQREKYLSDLRKEVDETRKRKNHFESEIKKLRDSKETVKRFTYEENYEKLLLNDIENCMKNIEHTNELKIQLKEETEKLNVEIFENNQKIKNTTEKIDIIKKQISILNDFTERNKQYMQEWGKYNKLTKEKKQLELKISLEEDEKNRFGQENSKLTGDISFTTYELNNIKKSLLSYSDAIESNYIEGSPETLEREYVVLKEQQGRSIKELEEKLLNTKNELDEREKELTRIGLEIHEYEVIIFDGIKYAAIAEEINSLSDEAEKRQEDFNKATKSSGGTEERFRSASQTLRNQDMIRAIDKSEIKGNYENRRKTINFELGKIREKEKEYTKNKNSYENYRGLITVIVIVKQLPAASFSLKKDIAQQFNELKVKHESSKKAYENSKNEYGKLFNSIKSRYDNKHQSIADILNSIDTLNINDSTYDKIYYYYEELTKKRESLSKYLSFYEQQLQNIEHTKKQVIDQCVSYATLIYEDIKSITEKSKVKMTGRNKSVKMLKIDIPDKTDNYVRNRMEEHISSAVKIMADLYESDKDSNIKKYRDKIKGIVSTRELLNQLIGTSKIPVSVYKVDLNERNSGLKKWEDAISENSGGEKFVVFFTLVSVLISYTRDATVRRMGEDSLNESKVIIMDNPFGKTSSEHLLKAIMDIAGTFSIQLICLSDLSQSSITNRFSLIYRLSIRKRMYSDTEVLKIEELTFNKQGLYENERLEHAMMHQTTFEQENMFGLFDNI